jgi:hypothetical protein
MTISTETHFRCDSSGGAVIVIVITGILHQLHGCPSLVVVQDAEVAVVVVLAWV